MCGSAAAARRDAEEAAARLERRRERLRRLLGEEREALAAELRERRQRGGMRSQELRDGPGECGRKVRERPGPARPVLQLYQRDLLELPPHGALKPLRASAGFGMLSTPYPDLTELCVPSLLSRRCRSAGTKTTRSPER